MDDTPTHLHTIHPWVVLGQLENYYNDAFMSTMTSHITGVSIVYSAVCSGADQRKQQSSVLVALCVENAAIWWRHCLCGGNSPATGEFPAQRASYAENVSIWWRHHESSPRASFSWPRLSSVIWLKLNNYTFGSPIYVLIVYMSFHGYPDKLYDFQHIILYNNKFTQNNMSNVFATNSKLLV